jgi:hypothetical protein
MWVLERVLGKRQPVGAVAHRGTAVETGVAHHLLNPQSDPQEAVNLALKTYDTLTPLSGDPRTEEYKGAIPEMVLRSITELRPYGIPSECQKFVEWRPEGLRCPIIGYADFIWDKHGIVVDLKTTDKMPSKVKASHARQASLYGFTSNNLDCRITYTTPRKTTTYGIENVRDHLDALHRIALTVERFVTISNDPFELVGLVAPDVDSYYWTNPGARQMAYETWKI